MSKGLDCSTCEHENDSSQGYADLLAQNAKLRLAMREIIRVDSVNTSKLVTRMDEQSFAADVCCVMENAKALLAEIEGEENA